MTTTAVRTLSPWIFAATPRPQERLRLFCFHHAGGGASMFRAWADMLPDDISVYPVQLPGRESRRKESLVPHSGALVEMMADNLYPYLEQPFAFFGHSMGALVCFELARELRRRGWPLPRHLFVSSYHAPQWPPQRPYLYKLSDTQLVRALLHIDESQREIIEDENLQALLLPIIRADFSVCETYHYQSEDVLPLPITVSGGRQDLRVTYDELETWCEQTSETFNMHLLTGGHFYLQNSPKPLLQIIAQESRQYVH